MSTHSTTQLWKRIESHLDRRLPDWRSRIQHFGQVDAIKNRNSGKRWADDEIQEGLVRAVLSSNTDWAKIEGVLPELNGLFGNFSLSFYAQLTTEEIDRIFVPWFKSRKAASMTLGKDLKNLIKTSQKLKRWSESNGSAEHYFTDLYRKCSNDAKRVALKIGLPESEYKLPALGVPIAAETLRNIGFDLAKPDRHILRAAGSFGLVQFSNWKDTSSKNPPIANPAELLATMTAFESLADAQGLLTAFVDNAVWLLCAKSGLRFSNSDLNALNNAREMPNQ